LGKGNIHGAVIAKEPQQVFWGGYSGYFTDPNGKYKEDDNVFLSVNHPSRMAEQ